MELAVQRLSPEAPATLHTIADYLEGRNPEADAVSSILEINHETIHWKGINAPLSFLWCHISSASRFVGLDSKLGERLVDLIIAFARLPPPTNPRLINEPQWSDAKRVWLKGFGIAFREYGIGNSYSRLQYIFMDLTQDRNRPGARRSAIWSSVRGVDDAGKSLDQRQCFRGPSSPPRGVKPLGSGLVGCLGIV